MTKKQFRIMMDILTFIMLIFCMLGFVHIWASVAYRA